MVAYRVGELYINNIFIKKKQKDIIVFTCSSEIRLADGNKINMS